MVFLITTGGIILSLLVFSKNQRSMTTVKLTKTPTLETLLIPTKTSDTLPHDTLTIPKDKWGEKMPVLAQRALTFFEKQKITPQSLPKNRIADYQAFIKAWGKPWRLYFLQTAFARNELQLIWNQLLLVQANTPEELADLQKKVVAELAKIQPPVEFTTKDLSKHYATEIAVQQAVKRGELIPLKLTAIISVDPLYAKPTFAQIVNSAIDPALADFKGTMEITSATRSLELQALLRKLGYHATYISYHTVGQAIDLHFTARILEQFNKDYLYQPVSSSSTKTRLVLVNELYQQDVQPTFRNLLLRGVLTNDYSMVKELHAIENSLLGKGVDIIDETPFGLRIDAKGKITEINPTFHLQYSAAKNGE